MKQIFFTKTFYYLTRAANSLTSDLWKGVLGVVSHVPCPVSRVSELSTLIQRINWSSSSFSGRDWEQTALNMPMIQITVDCKSVRYELHCHKRHRGQHGHCMPLLAEALEYDESGRFLKWQAIF